MENRNTIFKKLGAFEYVEVIGLNNVVIYFRNGKALQSYYSIIAVKLHNGTTYIDKDRYQYSRTTARHRNMFLGRTLKEIKRFIKEKKYKLVELN